MDLDLPDRTCLETVHSDGLISEDLDRRTSIACTPACNHPTRNNESQDLLVPSRARLHTSYDSQFASMYRSIYAVTIRPKSLYEDVHASTGHPGYTGMQWHQKNTIGANYTDKDAAAPRGICQGCALGSAHQYPTNQHYVMSDTPHDQVSSLSLTPLRITALATMSTSHQEAPPSHLNISTSMKNISMKSSELDNLYTGYTRHGLS